MKIRPKKFGPVITRFSDQSEVTFAMGGDGPALPHPPTDTPVDILLASVGHCMVKSVTIVVKGDKIEPGPFSVSVVGEKATDLPGRLQSVRCEVSGIADWAPEGEAEIIARAKAMCTVSNTLNCEVTASAA
jgi:uncharacterized OsmC-like protein